jgi:hypothetical protein
MKTNYLLLALATIVPLTTNVSSVQSATTAIVTQPQLPTNTPTQIIANLNSTIRQAREEIKTNILNALQRIHKLNPTENDRKLIGQAIQAHKTILSFLFTNNTNIDKADQVEYFLNQTPSTPKNLGSTNSIDEKLESLRTVVSTILKGTRTKIETVLRPLLTLQPKPVTRTEYAALCTWFSSEAGLCSTPSTQS